MAAALAAAGCDRVPANAVTRCESRIDAGVARTDILFVIDDSGSMTEEQQNIHDNLGLFVDALASSAITNDVQVGVTTTSVLDFDGVNDLYYVGTATAPTPYYSLPYRVPYPKGTIVAVARDATGNAINGRLDWDNAVQAFVGRRILPGSAIADFQANVLVGTAGTGKEQPFHAARNALTSPLVDGPNATFLRHGARLAIVFVTDEDDCSESSGSNTVTSNDLCHKAAVKAGTELNLDPVSGFADFLDGDIAGEQRNAVVAVIAGIGTDAQGAYVGQACATSFDTADRFATLLNLLPARRRYADSICNPSFGPSLKAIAELLVPQKMPISGEPPSAAMLEVTVTKATGVPVACAVSDADGPGVDVIFTAAQGSEPATLSFQGKCQLGLGDRVDVRIRCAG
jgi:hypothetical protein